MFIRPTVFITGAGASSHYGYPTGEELVREVITKARALGNHCRDVVMSNSQNFLTVKPDIVNRHLPKRPAPRGLGIDHMKEQWSAASAECDQLAERLVLAHPPVIDYFLGWNDDLQEIGKFITAWVILECEANYIRTRGPHQRDANDADHWHRFIIYKLVSGYRDPKRLLDNKVTFITFNYDISMEMSLAQGIGAYGPMQPFLREFQTKYDVMHVYGRVRDYPVDLLDPLPPAILPKEQLSHVLQKDIRYPTKFKDVMDYIYTASKRIKTIGPQSKDDNDSIINQAKAAIAAAEDIYICGYGFDENNSTRLGLRGVFHGSAKPQRNVYFTNYKGYGRVTKRASRLFEIQLSATNLVGARGNRYIEMSTSDVYRAFQNDFEYPDE